MLAGHLVNLILLTREDMDDYRKVKIKIPRWATWLYVLIAIGMIPWTIYLSFHLPTHHLSRNWDITWVGLDAAIIASLLATALLAKFSSIYMVLSATISGTLFLTDAWFDILGYRLGSHGFAESLVMATFGEIPLAIMSFTLAIHGLRRLHSKS